MKLGRGREGGGLTIAKGEGRKGNRGTDGRTDGEKRGRRGGQLSWMDDDFGCIPSPVMKGRNVVGDDDDGIAHSVMEEDGWQRIRACKSLPKEGIKGKWSK